MTDLDEMMSLRGAPRPSDAALAEVMRRGRRYRTRRLTQVTLALAATAAVAGTVALLNTGTQGGTSELQVAADPSAPAQTTATQGVECAERATQALVLDRSVTCGDPVPKGVTWTAAATVKEGKSIEEPTFNAGGVTYYRRIELTGELTGAGSDTVLGTVRGVCRSYIHSSMLLRPGATPPPYPMPCNLAVAVQGQVFVLHATSRSNGFAAAYAPLNRNGSATAISVTTINKADSLRLTITTS